MQHGCLLVLMSSSVSGLLCGRCDDGWHGESCSSPVSPLPGLLSDSFTLPPGKKNWGGINGGHVSKKCGVLASGPQLLFDGVS